MTENPYHEIGDTEFVAVTGYGQPADRQRAKEAGFDRHLLKPADYAKVKGILAEVSRRISR
jgi:CheY-like chemotaxis protein